MLLSPSSVLQATDGVITSPLCPQVMLALCPQVRLALCPQVMSQASKHFRSSEMKAIFDGCFACQSFCSVMSLHCGKSQAVHPQDFSSVSIKQCLMPVWVSHSTVCSKLVESVRIDDGMCGLSPFQAVQWRACVTCFHVSCHAALSSWILGAPRSVVKFRPV